MKANISPLQYYQLRVQLGTQAEVAELLGVHVMTISRRERGEIEIPREAEMALRAGEEIERENMSDDTPRTDAFDSEKFDYDFPHASYDLMADFARTLERENARQAEEITRLRSALGMARSFIANLRVPQDPLGAGLQVINGRYVLEAVDAALTPAQPAAK